MFTNFTGKLMARCQPRTCATVSKQMHDSVQENNSLAALEKAMISGYWDNVGTITCLIEGHLSGRGWLPFRPHRQAGCFSLLVGVSGKDEIHEGLAESLTKFRVVEAGRACCDAMDSKKRCQASTAK